MINYFRKFDEITTLILKKCNNNVFFLAKRKNIRIIVTNAAITSINIHIEAQKK